MPCNHNEALQSFHKREDCKVFQLYHTSKMENTVTIIFENASQAEAFMRWLDNSGEQEYFSMAEIMSSKAYVDTFKYDFMNRVIVGETNE